MRSTQVQPEVLIGLFADLPNPANISQGYLYFATDTIQLFVLKIDPVTQTRTWVQTTSGATPLGIPLDQIAFGNAVGGLQSSPHLTFDPILGVFSQLDNTGAAFISVDGAPGTGHRTESWSDGTQLVVNIVTDPTARAVGDNTGRGFHAFDAAGMLRYSMRSDPVAPGFFSVNFFDSTGVLYSRSITTVGTRESDWLNTAGNATQVQFKSTASSAWALFSDTTGISMLFIDQLNRIITYASGTIVGGAVNKGINFVADPTVSREFLTADGLTVTLNDALLAIGWTCEFWSMTGTLAPANIFAPTAGTIVSSGIPAAATSTWPPGATVVTVTKQAAGVYVRT